MSIFSFLNIAKCPVCAKGRLYAGLLKVNDVCSECGFEIGKNDAADGPAFFTTLIVGSVVCGLAAFVEIKYSPPVWLHFLLWIPLLFVSSVICLRISKAVMIKVQYKIRGKKEWGRDGA